MTMIPPYLLDITPEEAAYTLRQIKTILQTGRLTLGPFSEEFEQEFAQIVGISDAVSVNSGSTALEIIFRALGVSGRDVLVPTNTNFATAAAAINAGANVVLFDGGLYPSVEDIASKISHRTAAVVVVHIGGYISEDTQKIREICDRRGIFFVEDAAHAHHATLNGRHAGSFGHAAAFSFYPTKVVTTGEGGMIVTNNGRLAEVARRMRDQGKDASGDIHTFMGNSWRLTEMGSALGLTMMRSLRRDTEYRRAVMSRYERELDGCPGLSFPRAAPGMGPSGYKSIALLAPGVDRAAFVEAMSGEGVGMSRPVYAFPLHRQPIFRSLPGGPFPLADDFCARHICFPLWRSIPSEQQDAVIAATRRVMSWNTQKVA